MQRDHLIDSYVKSQKLAIAVGRDNHERAVFKALSVMRENSNRIKLD